MAATIFSKQLQKLRKERGIKQEQLAEYLGVSTQAVSKWENGSYPDGDLLPKIAAYFEVSIDYLYGNEQSTKSLAEQVEDFLREKIEAREFGDIVAVEEMKNFQWAMQRASFGKTAFRKYESTKERVCGSGIVSSQGFSIMRLSDDLEYYCMMQKPENGFEEYFSNTEELAKLFNFLGDEKRLKILFFMMSLKQDECVRAETVANTLGISLEIVQETLRQANNMSSKGYLTHSQKLITEQGATEEVYQCTAHIMTPFLMMLAAAQDILYSIGSWYGFYTEIRVPWFDREKLLKTFQEEKKK